MLLALVVVTGNVYGSFKLVNHADWMSKLDPNAYVCRLCLPGVHDGATGRTHVYGTSVQTKEINEMFDAGVRVYDLRVGLTGGQALRMYHGGIDLARTFKGVMNDLYAKLEEHKGEFVVVVVNIESATTQKGNCAKHLRSYFRPSYKQDEGEDYWENESKYSAAKAKWMKFKPDMTVGEARGHMIVFFRDDIFDNLSDFPGARLGGFPSSPGISSIRYWDGETRTAPFLCQDAYHENEIEDNLSAKFEKFVRPTCEMLTDKINNSPNEFVWCINHLSAYTNDPAAPNSAIVARQTARQFSRYMTEHPELYTGMVMMDYAAETSSWGYTVYGDIALETIIHQNYRFWQIPTDSKRNHVVVNSN